MCPRLWLHDSGTPEPLCFKWSRQELRLIMLATVGSWFAAAEELSYILPTSPSLSRSHNVRAVTTRKTAISDCLINQKEVCELMDPLGFIPVVYSKLVISAPAIVAHPSPEVEQHERPISYFTAPLSRVNWRRLDHLLFLSIFDGYTTATSASLGRLYSFWEVH